MCPGIEGIEGTSQGHDAIAVAKALPWLKAKGHSKAVEYLEGLTKIVDTYEYKGSGKAGNNRGQVGDAICAALSKMSEADRKAKVMVIDSDLGGSTTMTKVQKKFP